MAHWEHTSVMLAMTANVHRDPKKCKPFSPADFNPYVDSQPTGDVIDASSIDLLKVWLPNEADS